jgi:hypothetical protein
MAGGSLTWQVISWRRSGPRVTVKTTWGIITGTPRHGAWFVGIDAKNSGRLGTQVHQFGFKLPNGRTIVGREELSWLRRLRQDLLRLTADGRGDPAYGPPSTFPTFVIESLIGF